MKVYKIYEGGSTVGWLQERRNRQDEYGISGRNVVNVVASVTLRQRLLSVAPQRAARHTAQAERRGAARLIRCLRSLPRRYDRRWP